MTKEVLNEREFELINIVGSDLGSNQRDLSRQLDLSLGLTNMLLRRLISKGYIRISQLNKSKVKYLLTPKGFAEKMQKSIKYTLKTVRSISLIKEKIKQVVVKLYEQGERDFVILGRSDFALLIEMVFKEMELTDYKIVYVDELPSGEWKGICLICKEDVDIGEECPPRTIDLIRELAKDSIFVNHAYGDLEHAR